jgi:tRNA dimethylallyltransferase
LLCLTGPTAVGKSDVALLLAERLSGEIISVDSMQVYQGLDLGTAKPSADERQRVPHHLLDVCPPTQHFDAAQFVTLARAAVDQIQGRDRLAIFCGGTGLYLKAYLYGLGNAPKPDPSLRAELERVPLPELLNELAAADPAAYQRIDKQNSRRVLRAVEILRQSGGSSATQRADWTQTPPSGIAPPARVIALVRPLPDLYRRVDARVDQMFQRGLVAETRHLLQQTPELSVTALQAIGYRQVVEHLQGARSLEETIALIKQRTRQFARRQLTWLRHQLPLVWINWSAGESAEQVSEEVERAFRAPVVTPSAPTTT